MNSTIIGVDLAKNVIQVCITKNRKVISNTEMTSEAFMCFLAIEKTSIIIFEACATSNYWKQTALSYGHDARLISAKLVSKIRQNQKTDKNDALAIVQASQLIDIQFIQGKTFAQQELQTISRMRELAVKHKDGLGSHLESLLLEFNIRISNRNGGLRRVINSVLEDAENGFSDEFRSVLYDAWQMYLKAVERVLNISNTLSACVEKNEESKRLMALEGVSTINAIHLYTSLACAEDKTYTSGADASACIGLTPIQYSSGGRTKLGSIGRAKNSIVRSNLISGAMAVVRQLIKREPRTTKEKWLKGVMKRRGNKCAAVALANKTVRTAFAMLRDGTEYHAQPLVAE